MIKYIIERDAADAVAEAKGWKLREDWSVEWASECDFWYDGERKVIERELYQPLTDENIVALMRQHDLNIKPTYRTVKSSRVRLWHVQSNHGPYAKHFMSPEIYDAVAQWLVGYYEFQQTLKTQLDCV